MPNTRATPSSKPPFTFALDGIPFMPEPDANNRFDALLAAPRPLPAR